jgi:hypothetical protein
MPKQSRFDKRSVGTPGKNPAARRVWLLLGLAAALLAAMTRKASGRPFPRQTSGSPGKLSAGGRQCWPGNISVLAPSVAP